MTADEATTNSRGAVTAAQAIAAALDLGADVDPVASWAVAAGTTVLGASFGGDREGTLLLAVGDEMVERLAADRDRLADGFRRGLAAYAAASGTDLALGEIGIADLTADHAVEIRDQGALVATFGLVVESAAAETGGDSAGSGAAAFEPAPLHGNGYGDNGGAAGALHLLHDVDMEVTVELGRTTMPIRELLSLRPGMVVELDRAAGAPVDVLVNGRLIASGEVVVIDEEFGIRITEIASAGDRA